jgi:hypothetical protein
VSSQKPAVCAGKCERGALARGARIEIDEAARRAVPSLKAPAGTIVIAE